MNIDIKSMTITDYDEVAHLWANTDGVGLRDFEDSCEGIASYLDRNCGMSFVARRDGKLVGAVLCGHDGRRGCIYHLAVASEYRRQGIGKTLLNRSISELRAAGIRKCNIVVFKTNSSGQEFWRKLNWNGREDLMFMQISVQ